MKITGNEPAYPVSTNTCMEGLTIRQQFAMAAMQGLASSATTVPIEIAEVAVIMADALINELNKSEL